jgi:dephospho-CoA kinase
MIVGLTGGIGSGKTTIASFFKKQLAVAVYIADAEAKIIMNSSEIIRAQLIESFGKEIYQNNQLNSLYLAKIVFEDIKLLTILNSIVHPEVKKKFQEFVVQNADKAYILYESAILFESKSAEQCNFIISVFAHQEERIQRVINRDRNTRTEVLSRIHNQWKEDKKLLQSHYVINNYALQDTEASVLKIHNILTKKAHSIL